MVDEKNDNNDGRRNMGILKAHLRAFGSGELNIAALIFNYTTVQFLMISITYAFETNTEPSQSSEPCHEKTCFLHMRTQRGRSAAR